MLPLVIAHRGASAAEPENTLRAFDLAIRQGAQMIELDLQVTRDRHVIVLHDDDLDRTTDREGRVDQLTFNEVRLANAGKGERVPSLKETLELARGRARLYLEIKDARAGLETVRIVRAMGCRKEVMIASFDTALMKRLGDEVHDIELGVIIGTPTVNPLVRWREALPWVALRGINYQVLSVHSEMCFGYLASQVKCEGKRLYVWTVDDERTFGLMIQRGVDGICTNVPDKLVAYLKRKESLP
ncbi:MAG TPA: glycerophosphodiester phosphodiesterase [Blastocatellia bacterium]|nr:glycerophosphodiester phosphodiesterase [Blastocatellia bacterium]